MDKKGNANGKWDKSKKDDSRDSGRHFLSPDNTNIERTPSLHGLHAQSSTETSGLGETITSGFSSQESINSVRGSTRVRDTGGLSLTPEEAEARARASRERAAGATTSMRSESKRNNGSSFAGNQNFGNPDSVRGNYEDFFLHGAPMADSLVPMGLQREHIDEEWEKRSNRSRRSSVRSRSSHGGSCKSRNSKRNFLGKDTESAWTKWSRDRRASFRRRVELIDKVEKPEERTSTPVKKARQECLKFVHPDLEGKYLSEDDIKELRRHKQEKYHTYRVIEKTKKHKNPFKTEIQLSVGQWHVINEFWDHDFFVRFRWVGVFVSLLTLLLMIVSVTNHYWLTATMSTRFSNLTLHEGLWVNCSRPSNESDTDYTCRNSNGRGFSAGIWASCYQNLSDPEAVAKCPEKKPRRLN